VGERAGAKEYRKEEGGKNEQSAGATYIKPAVKLVQRFAEILSTVMFAGEINQKLGCWRDFFKGGRGGRGGEVWW
jgi:hypothetical protein